MPSNVHKPARISDICIVNSLVSFTDKWSVMVCYMACIFLFLILSAGLIASYWTLPDLSYREDTRLKCSFVVLFLFLY